MAEFLFNKSENRTLIETLEKGLSDIPRKGNRKIKSIIRLLKQIEKVQQSDVLYLELPDKDQF